MPNIETVLRDCVTLNVDCIDRLYLNGYIPLLQRPGNLWWFFHEHRRQPFMSPTLITQANDAFVASIRAFADEHQVPIVHFERGVRKEDVAQQRLAKWKGGEGVLFIGVAQEKVSGFRCYLKRGKRRRHRGAHERDRMFSFYRGEVFVNQYYFYLVDRDFGLCFIKFSSHLPFGIRVWLNVHEWAKHQLDRRGIRYQGLDNGFFDCADPEALQQTCDNFSPEHIEKFFRRWLARLPHPLSPKDRKAGYRYKLTILQMEVSLTQVFDRPLSGREFFEEVIRDYLDVGRPDRVQLLFERRVTRRTPGRFRTRVLTAGVQPSLRFDYKRTAVKQYFKRERALRTETTFNDTYDFGIGRSLGNLPRLRTLGRHINHRLLTLERVAHNCAIASQTVERIVLPTATDDGQRAPALRWGDPRSMAVLSALCAFQLAPQGFTNSSLRERVALLHDPGPTGYGAGRMTYDLRRLRLKGLITRVPHTRRYMLTPLGRRVALFMSKSYVRVVRPVFHRLDTQLPEDAPDPLRQAWHACERALDSIIAEARMAA